MTVKLIALYKRPEDEKAFLDHYENVHAPLARKVPGLEKLVVNRVTGSPMGEAEYFLIAEMHFPDRATFDAAMASEENRAAGKDLMSFAKGMVTILFAEDA
ncbi:MAG: EthD family reductase [Sphingobium sp.]|jgi:uncharacterized protein (TIGR02118 family)|nr:EthD family reductase [Sphingobium sp.]MCI1271719.1 EthD family reductase [Sphingobium sp.]MCI1756120.1 EthD family reductase [Sphingobium sp.]MCI2053557.1 EthD family reductase [Sphingobium sp.]